MRNVALPGPFRLKLAMVPALPLSCRSAPDQVPLPKFTLRRSETSVPVPEILKVLFITVAATSVGAKEFVKLLPLQFTTLLTVLLPPLKAPPARLRVPAGSPKDRLLAGSV